MAGIKPKSKVNRTWSPKLAYAIGLLASDGCLSNDGRHIDFTSKDIDQIETFLECLGIKNKIGQKISGYSGRACPRVQFGDIEFYKFLIEIGLSPKKSKTLGKIKIPSEYFFDFLRGSFDGDGTFYSYYDPRWKNSFMFYLVFISASLKHLEWVRDELQKMLLVKGHLTNSGKSTYQLRYAKSESLKILRKMYYKKDIYYLQRKYLKVLKALSIVSEKL